MPEEAPESRTPRTARLGGSPASRPARQTSHYALPSTRDRSQPSLPATASRLPGAAAALRLIQNAMFAPKTKLMSATRLSASTTSFMTKTNTKKNRRYS